ncbi:C40 family peptidase [Lentisalinibacter sediminis]|uniref:C40 family peptidase n=1 Tax=Lentisalinibacter sediminis TaxID=2992237 RepID=UPI00386A2242
MRRIGQIGSNYALASALATALAIGGCAWQPVELPPDPVEVPTRPVTQQTTLGDRAAAIALQQIGTPYRYGGQTPAGFDCSGLVHYAYGRAGRSVPRTTGALWSRTRPVPRDELRAGDLLFFSIDGKMQHVGLYVGEGRFAHAPSSGRTVTVESLSAKFYRQAFLRGGRLH